SVVPYTTLFRAWYSRAAVFRSDMVAYPLFYSAGPRAYERKSSGYKRPADITVRRGSITLWQCGGSSHSCAKQPGIFQPQQPARPPPRALTALHHPAARLHFAPGQRGQVDTLKRRQVPGLDAQSQIAIQLQPHAAPVALHPGDASAHQGEARARQLARRQVWIPLPESSTRHARPPLELPMAVHQTEVGGDRHLKGQPVFQQQGGQVAPVAVVQVRQLAAMGIAPL